MPPQVGDIAGSIRKALTAGGFDRAAYCELVTHNPAALTDRECGAVLAWALLGEVDRLIQALEWALGDGDDPGAWPDGAAMPDGHKAWVDGLRAPTELVAVTLYNRGGRGWLPASVRLYRRTCAARRALAFIRSEVPRE